MSAKSRWIVAFFALFAAVALGWYWRENSLQRRIAHSRSNLKSIGLALHQYHDRYERFPPAYVMGPDDKPWHSWRVLLLPFLDEKPLYDRYRFDEPWDGPHNRLLHAMRPKVYASRLQTSRSADVATYLGVVSRRTMWPAHFSVQIRDVSDGTSNTIHLVENKSSDVIWSEPRELKERDVIAKLQPRDNKRPDTAQRIPLLFVDGQVRLISPQINRDLLISLLTPKYGEYMIEDGWPREHQAAARIPDAIDISRYHETRLLPTAGLPLNADLTTLYCATAQLAWDTLRPAADAPVAVVPTTEASDLMNETPFPRSALASDAYFVGAASLDDAGSAAMFEQFRNRFPDAPVEMLGNAADLPGIRILAYLQKSLPFPDLMERFTLPLEFDPQRTRTKVNSFGWPAAGGEGAGMDVLKQTVTVRDYLSNDDFIVTLHSDSPELDEIILARITPEATLRKTWEAAAARLQTPRASVVVQRLRAGDHLQIPVLSFGMVGSFSELKGLNLPTRANPNRFISDAQQSIRFRLDEFGAELIADTQMVVGENGDSPLHINPLEPRRLILDRPFLLAIKQKSTTTPYFLAWIANADLMEVSK